MESKYSRLQWAEQFHSDPYTFVDSWLDQLAGHPQYQQQIYAKAARMLQSRRGSQPAQTELPDVPIMDANGQVVGKLSDHLKAALDARLQPLESKAAEREQREALAEISRQSDEHARTTLDKMRKTSWFSEHEAAIKKHFAEHEEYGDNLQAAAMDYFNDHVLPTYGQQAESRVLANLKQQAAGATVTPGGSGSAAPPKFKDFKEAMAYYAQHPDEAEAMARR